LLPIEEQGVIKAGTGDQHCGENVIEMTTVATVVGHFPLTLVTGAGAVARNSIGIVLVGGMSIGTLFTLFVVPSVYVLIARDHRREGARETGAEPADPDA